MVRAHDLPMICVVLIVWPDRGVNTFSPEGRLFQGKRRMVSYVQPVLMLEPVEYAIEAIKVIITEVLVCNPA